MIDRRIVRFLKKHHVLTIATSVNNEPWCANCFYVFLEEEAAFVFTTDKETRHGKEFLLNPSVAGSVVLETRIPGRIRGIQFQGEVAEAEGDLLEKSKRMYLGRFPVAMLMDTHLWVVRPKKIKMTDNRLGFGKKLNWSSED